MALTKHDSIHALLARLDLPAHGWVVHDHWEADLCAIGIARADDLGRLVYVSTFGVPAGSYEYECERGQGASDANYAVTARGLAPSIEALLEVMRTHLG